MHEILSKMFDLSGKVAIVTGGGGGIGKAIAQVFAGAGADVVIADIDRSKMAQTADELREHHATQVLAITADVREETQVQAMIDQTLSTFSGIDIFVNNAGIAIHKPPQTMTLDEWDRNISVNLRSVFICSQNAYPALKLRGGGKIINIGSMFAIFGAGMLPAYAASKGGVLQLTRSLAIAWAPDNIQVNAILPGFINTDLSADGKRDVAGMEQDVVDRTPAGRWGEPVDCAGAALFLASRASTFVTGAALPVDGGYSVR